MTAFDVVDYDVSLRDDYIRLLREAWGEHAVSDEVFDWWVDGNPEGSVASMAVLDGDVVGGSTHTVVRAQIGQSEERVQFSLLAVTSESARGLGVWRSLEQRNEERGRGLGTALALTFANDLTTPIFLGPLGWTRIDRRRVWGRPLRGLLLRAARRGGGNRDEWHDGVLRVTRFGPEHDALYDGVRDHLGDHVRRDHRHLNWRYLDSARPYTALASGDGFAVLGRTRRRGLSFALLLDLVAAPEHAALLLRACVAASAGADALLAVPSPCLPKTTLARHGFAPTHERLELLGYGLAARLDARPERWTYTLGDTDFF